MAQAAPFVSPLAVDVESVGPTPDAAAPAETAAPHDGVAAPVWQQEGLASWYGGKRWHGRRTASGERFDRQALTAAHRTLPLGSLVRVLNPLNGLEVVVRINDRGPFVRRRIIDLSEAAAEQIGLRHSGHGQVHLSLFSDSDALWRPN